MYTTRLRYPHVLSIPAQRAREVRLVVNVNVPFISSFGAAISASDSTIPVTVYHTSSPAMLLSTAHTIYQVPGSAESKLHIVYLICHIHATPRDVVGNALQVLTDLNQAAGELGLGPRPLNVAVGREEGELEVTVDGGLIGDKAKTLDPERESVKTHCACSHTLARL